jgi:hypothetical protein
MERRQKQKGKLSDPNYRMDGQVLVRINKNNVPTVPVVEKLIFVPIGLGNLSGKL